jgi:hypothetical protein
MTHRKYYPMVWLLWEYEEGEKYLEGVYAHKIKAEEVMRVLQRRSPKQITFGFRK